MRKATGSYLTYSIPGKTAALVSEFAVEDLPSAELQQGSDACNEGPDLRQNTLIIIIFHCIKLRILRYNNNNNNNNNNKTSMPLME